MIGSFDAPKNSRGVFFFLEESCLLPQFKDSKEIFSQQQKANGFSLREKPPTWTEMNLLQNLLHTTLIYSFVLKPAVLFIGRRSPFERGS